MTKRFLVSYFRRNIESGLIEHFQRDLYATNMSVAWAMTKGLPRFEELISIKEIARETPAEVAARVARENNAPVPYDC